MIIYLAHPVSGDSWANLQKAKAWYRWILRSFPDVAIIADWIISCEVLADHLPEDRARGMAANDLLLPRADEVWLTGEERPDGTLSKGMEAEVVLAQQLEIPVRSFLSYNIFEPWPPKGKEIQNRGHLVRLLPTCHHLVYPEAQLCAWCVKAGKSIAEASL